MNSVREATSVSPLSRLVMVSVVSALTVLFATKVFASTANLSWNAPTTYTDGTPIQGVGFVVSMGTAPGSYSESVDVGSVTSYTVGGLVDSTTYYFAVQAYDTTGNVSGYSNQVSYTTPPANALFTISASAGSGGSIRPSGAVIISEGASQTFAITPNTGYSIAGVTVDGRAVGAVSSYTVGNVTANHTLSATFALASCATPPVSISGATVVYYPDFPSAYTAAVDGATIQLQALNFSGDLLLNRDLLVTLEGGYACGNMAKTGTTGIAGKMRVISGTVKVENLRLI